MFVASSLYTYGRRHGCTFARVHAYAVTMGEEAELVLRKTRTVLLFIGKKFLAVAKCACKTKSKRTVNFSGLARQCMRSTMQYVVGDTTDYTVVCVKRLSVLVASAVVQEGRCPAEVERSGGRNAADGANISNFVNTYGVRTKERKTLS